jgi:hypothetical protein
MGGGYKRKLGRERVNYCRKQGLSGLKPGHHFPEFCYTTRTFVFGNDRQQIVITLSGGVLDNIKDEACCIEF